MENESRLNIVVLPPFQNINCFDHITQIKKCWFRKLSFVNDMEKIN
jgi:hypothetical protein